MVTNVTNIPELGTPVRVEGFRGIKQYGHWLSLVGVFNPTDHFGFIYCVVDNTNKRFYIGKKQFHSSRRLKVPGKNYRKLVKKESDWLKYTGSSEYLTSAISEHGIENFEFFIVGIYNSKGGLRYAECNALHKFDALIKKDAQGQRVFYNAQIDNVKFVPVEYNLMTEYNIKKIMAKRR